MLTLLSLVLMADAVTLPSQPLPSSSGAPMSLSKELSAHTLTALVFFSPDCPVMKAHDAQLQQLSAALEGKGVQFIAVHSQAESTPAEDGEQAKQRGYRFPLVSDPEGLVADAVGARFSTLVVVIDQRGVVRYRGGIDSARNKPDPNATPHLKLALEALLAGQEPPQKETKAMGCVLRRK